MDSSAVDCVAAKIWHRPDETVASKPVTDALVPRSRNGRYPKTLLIVIFGLRGQAFERAIDAIAGERQDELEPVVLTDYADFAQLRAENLIFEYFPSNERRNSLDGTLPWDLYFDRRFARIVRKWAPVRAIAFGSDANAFLSRQRHSPLTDRALAEFLQMKDHV